MKEQYNDDFYNILNDINANSINKIVEIIMKKFAPKSVIDLGCGQGIWLRYFKENGGVKDVCGLDGDYVDRNKLLIEKEEFMPYDLSQRLNIGRKYDFAMSVEVAEHIDSEYADVFVDNLTELSDIIMFSAAIPGQGGVHHVNEQWQSYWKEKFETKGYRMYDCIRDEIWNDDNIAYYYRQNIVLYIKQKKEHLVQDDYLYSQNNRMVDVVHPTTYLKYKMNLEVMYGLEDLNKEVLGKFFKNEQVDSIAIYGAGKIGQSLYRHLGQAEYKISFWIDQYEDGEIMGYKVKRPEKIQNDKVDMIIVASPYHFSEMKRNIEYVEENGTKVIAIQDFIYKVLND